MLHIGSLQNDVWFAEEDEEENDGYWGVCLVFFLSHLHSMVEDRPFLCSEIDMQNES